MQCGFNPPRNKYIDETMPWALADENGRERLKAVLYNLVESIRYIAVMLKPFMPETSEKIAQQTNCGSLYVGKPLRTSGAVADGTKVGTATPLFARIDEAKKIRGA